MSALSSTSLPPAADAAVLLVLLPVSRPDGAVPPFSTAALERLQRRLGPAIRVLRIDEASHPTVVRSFHAQQLPACVLVRQGVELWRQPGLPDDEAGATELLGRLTAPAGVS
ncbi:thioredoxin [Hymenobacter jeollabukensis]|uniref:Thioredoxin n=1 Tax=Hymenobacter jeollabukensis TaxID=2025313 RepID=A0A5R8WQQ3_9BACT|nr:thioredoxin [Hymenobacter jeollabukensis]TLM92270.1 thioredoxin [Hymenobacter jeollabukensis]